LKAYGAENISQGLRHTRCDWSIRSMRNISARNSDFWSFWYDLSSIFHDYLREFIEILTGV
jgi:hypothetical protein